MSVFQMQRINSEVSEKHSVLVADIELCFLPISTVSALIYGGTSENNEAFPGLSQMKNTIYLHAPGTAIRHLCYYIFHLVRIITKKSSSLYVSIYNVTEV